MKSHDDTKPDVAAGINPFEFTPPQEVREWFYHLELHVTEHDLVHAGKALRAAWPTVRDYFLSRHTTAMQLQNRVRAREKIIKSIADLVFVEQASGLHKLHKIELLLKDWKP